MGLPRPRPDAEKIPVHHDEERGGEGCSEEEVEVAANPAEQGGEERCPFWHVIPPKPHPPSLMTH